MQEKAIIRMAALIALFLAGAGVQAQVSTSTIFGTVTDSSGAVAPNVEVTATNLATNFSRSATTDNEGRYQIQFLPVGTYRVEAKEQGFKTFSQSGIGIDVATQARVDPVLQVGAISENVSVVADAPLVNTADSMLGHTVQNTEIVNLPLVNRDVYQLLNLTPGVEQSTDTGNTFGYPEQRTMINGGGDGGAGSVNFYLDGGSNLAGLRNTGSVSPNPDAIQEFRVITNSYSAEFGRFGGGVVDIVTKSGTNELHGSAFEFVRNDKLNANDWGVLTRPPLRRSQFGGTLGGPIQKDKTFVFGSYSGLRQRQQDVKSSALVFDQAERGGDFSEIKTPINDPFASTKTPFPGNQIPVSRFDPAAAAILKQWIPLPNLANNGVQTVQPRPTNSDEGLLKIDHNLSQKHLLASSYYISKGNSSMGFLNGNNSNLAWSQELFTYQQQNFNASDTWLISPDSVNQFRVTLMRNYGNRVDSPAMSLGDFGSKFQVQGVPSLPNINVSGFFQLGNSIAGSPAGGNFYALRDVLSLNKGRHTLKMGGELSLSKMVQDSTLNNYGTFTIDGTKSGYALADFLLGAVKSMNQDAPEHKQTNGWYYSLFVQDDLRIHPRFILNLGLRYDLQTPMTDPQNRLLTFLPGRQSTVVPGAPLGLLFPGDRGVGRGIIGADTNNFAPRVGFAWDPFGKGRTSIRAAAGLFYGSISGNEWNSSTDKLPFAARQTFPNVKSLSDPYGVLPGGVSPYPFFYDPAHPRFILPASVSPIALDFRWPYTDQFNFSIQQQLMKDLEVTASYVGAFGHHLPFTNDVNYPIYTAAATSSNVDARRPYLPGTLSSITMLQSNMNSAYNGLQVQIDRRFARRFMLKGYYVWGKSLEGAQLQNTTTAGGAEDSNNLRLERGRTDFDRRQNFVVSGVWQIDYLKGQKAALRAMGNGWSLSGILSLRSGQPIGITSGKDNNLDGVSNDRPNLIGNPFLDPHRSRSAVTAEWFDPAAFAQPANGQDGNLARNVVDGPGFRNVDLSLFRSFKVRERMNLQFRMETINAFNLVSLSNPNGTASSPSFGKITAANQMRQAQLGLRLFW